MGTFNDLYSRYMEDPEFAELSKLEDERLEASIAIVRLREQLGLSQAELAKMVGTKQPTIARIESGESNTTMDMLSKIAYATGTNLQVSFI
ncbi:MAG: helix-turn-helix domain-containing protein [Lactobacillaceae bacterium]|jgi:predicted transcriptional regulator|nr:helix-turn-helix domain-containing protein [Lactobacillaceae bacterium]